MDQKNLTDTPFTLNKDLFLIMLHYGKNIGQKLKDCQHYKTFQELVRC